MRNSFYINKDGSITHKSLKKTVTNIDWIDVNQTKGRNYSVREIFGIIFLLIPIYGWLIWLSLVVGNKVAFGVWSPWPMQSMAAIQNTPDSIKIYCAKNGKLGLYEKTRLTPSIFDSIEQLPTTDYSAYVLEYNGRHCLYNRVQRKVMFNKSSAITYIGDNTALVKKDGKETKYSLIGMRLS